MVLFATIQCYSFKPKKGVPLVAPLFYLEFNFNIFVVVVLFVNDMVSNKL
jgi:hypothetical protein